MSPKALLVSFSCGDDHHMASIEDMNWYFWEAISLQAHDMFHKGFTSLGLEVEVNAITKETQESGKFSEDLRRRACLVEDALKPNTGEWRKAVAIEYEEMNREIEMQGDNLGLQGCVPEGELLRGFGAP